MGGWKSSFMEAEEREEREVVGYGALWRGNWEVG